MKPVDPSAFDRKQAEAAKPSDGYAPAMIRSQMNRRDWLLLLLLALIWGGAFLFIDVAVRQVPPITYVWLRVTIGAAGLWTYLIVRGERISLPKQVWGSILLLALLNNAIPFTLFGWSQTHIASGLASILNATTPIWGVVVAHFLTKDERMSPRKLAGVLLGFGGVATMIGPSLLSSFGTGALAELACVVAALSYALAAVWARRFKQLGISPFSITTGQLTVGSARHAPDVNDRRQAVDPPDPAGGRAGRDHRARPVLHRLGYVLYFRLIDRAGRDECAARHPARPAGRDPARKPVPRRDSGAAGFRGLGPDRARAGSDRRAAAYEPFPTPPSARSFAAAGLVQSRSPT